MGIRRFTLVLIMATSAACAAVGVTDDGSISRVVARPGPAKAVAQRTQAQTPTPTPPAREPEPREATARVVTPRQRPFARVGEVRLFHPSDTVVRVGFHQASDPNTRTMIPSKQAVRRMTMPSRARGTSRRSAADIVVDARADILAPVSGIVKRAGDYRLYCKHQDAFVIISPVGHPEIEVKVLHVSGRRVRAGDRVVAGKTLIAKRATKFPFGSQVDAYTDGPPKPHVHIEVTQLAVPSAVPQPGTGLAFGC